MVWPHNGIFLAFGRLPANVPVGNRDMDWNWIGYLGITLPGAGIRLGGLLHAAISSLLQRQKAAELCQKEVVSLAI